MLGSPNKESRNFDNVLRKLEGINMDDLYSIPNLFNVVSDEKFDMPVEIWRNLMSHPYTPTYIKQFFSAYIKSAISMIKRNSEDLAFVRETLNYLHNRLIFEKNKKRVYHEVVNELLEILVKFYHSAPEAEIIFDDFILSKEAVGLLEACLLVNMANYTESFLKSIVAMGTEENCSNLYEILCNGIKSKNRNKILLKIYTFIVKNGCDHGLHEKLLKKLNEHRIYQIKEDEELGNIVTETMTKSLESSERDAYCQVAAQVLPLNHGIVKLDRACCFCNDGLLTELFDTYHKLGKLIDLFVGLLFYYNPLIVLGFNSRVKLANISRKLTEKQTQTIVEHLCSTLEENSSETSEETNLKKQKLCDANFQEFVTDCCVVVLANASHPSLDSSTDVFKRLHQITGRSSPEATSTLKLYFNYAVFVGNLPREYFFQIGNKNPENEVELELLISNLLYSDTISEDMDIILSCTEKFPVLICSRLIYFYNHMRVEHMMTFAKNTALLSECYNREIFSRLTDLHSVIVVNILRESFEGVDGKLIRDPLEDISLAGARELIEADINNALTCKDSTSSPILHQLSLDSCYLRLAATAWISCKHPEHHGTMKRFCKPPPPKTPLPVIHGKLAGHALCRVMPEEGVCKPTEELIELYLSVGLAISSVDITDFIEFLVGKPEKYSSIVSILTMVFRSNTNACERYMETLKILKDHIVKTVTVSEGALTSVSLCNLLIAILHLSYLLKTDAGAAEHANLTVIVLKKTDLSMNKKVELAQTILDLLEDKDCIFQITQTLLDILELREIRDAADSNTCNFTLKSDNSCFINEVIRCLPSTSAQTLLCSTIFSTDLVESIAAPYVPLGMVPKLISKLSKDQVMSSIDRSTDAILISKCLLCLVQSSYPAHLLSLTFNKLFPLISNEKYVSDPDMIANICRSCELISKQKEVAKHHAPFILTTIFEHISHSNSALVKDITPAVYPLFDVCLVQGYQFLQTRLSPPARQLFVQLQGYYKQNVKYQGKT